MLGTEDKLKLLSFNVKGIGRRKKRCQIFRKCRKRNPDILLLQESHSMKNKETVWYKDWGSKPIYSHGDFNARGVCICIKKELTYKLHNSKSDKDGRILVIDITVKDIRLTLANIYAPNGDTPEFFKIVFDMVNSYDNTNIIIGGDMNLVLDISKDKRGGNPCTHEKCRILLLDYMKDNDMYDIWRGQNPDKYEYTWRSYHEPYIYCRLDFFLISFNLTGVSCDNNIIPGFRSDHDMVETSICINKDTRGKGFWKLNCNLLNNQKYIKAIEDCIDNIILDNPGTEDGLLWETLKCRIRGTSVKISSILRKDEERNFQNLEIELMNLKKAMPSSEDPKLCAREIKIIESKIEEIIRNKTEGARIRSKIKNYEEGEKSTKYFYNLEKRNYENKNIKLLLDDSGKELKSRSEIMKEEVRFYKSLYSSTTKHMSEHESTILYDDFISGLDIPTIGDEDLNSIFDEEKLYDVVKSFACNKSPGSDGLPIEFYKKFWQKLKPFMINSYIDSLKKGELSITQKQGVISLIPKKDKDPRLIKNWRPITLLNTDYKILTKYLTEFIKEHLYKIIHSNQKGFLQGRFIGENIVNAMSMIDYAEMNDIDLTLVFLDYKKAFDSVELNIINKCLESFGFGPNIRKWINCIYKSNQSCIINNGHISDFFTLERGLRQGCPLSPYLFIMVVEILAIAIRMNQNIKGIRINDIECKINQYADDTFLSLLDNKQSLNEAFSMIEKFSKISGLVLNKDKTEILNINNQDDKNNRWLREEVRLLGIILNKDVSKMIYANFKSKIKEIEDCIKIWKMRDLSIIGKINIIKSLASSKLIHAMSVLPSPPNSFFKELETVLYNFIWNSKVDRIKRKILIGTYENGGLKMIDIESQSKALKIKWLEKLLHNNHKLDNEFWIHWVIYNIPNISPEYLLKCNLDKKDVNNIIKFKKGSFWSEIFSEWCYLNYDPHPTLKDELLNQNLWFNSHIKVGKKMVFNKKLYEADVRYIKDILHNGKFLTIENIRQKYHVDISFLEYGGLINAIPRDWKKYLKNNCIELEGDQTEIKHLYYIDRISLSCKGIYNEYIKRICILPEEYAHSWANELGIFIDDLDWIECYPEVMKWTISTKLRSFYYQYRMKDIMSNSKLFKMKLKPSAQCNWCDNSSQDMVHLFWECTESKNIWSKLEDWLNVHLTNGNLEIKKEMIFLFDIEAGNLTNIINLITLITCRYIYVNKCLDIRLYFKELLHRIVEIKNIEYSIAQSKDKLMYHKKKWLNLCQE